MYPGAAIKHEAISAIYVSDQIHDIDSASARKRVTFRYSFPHEKTNIGFALGHVYRMRKENCLHVTNLVLNDSAPTSGEDSVYPISLREHRAKS